MNSLDLPVIYTNTDKLKFYLERELNGVISLQNVGLVLNENTETSLSDRRPYKEDESKAEEEAWKLLSDFDDECRDNFLRISDSGLRVRYYCWLVTFFDFLSKKSGIIMDNIEAITDQLSVDYDDETEYEIYDKSYFGRVNHWGWYLTEHITPDVVDVLNSYRLLIVNTDLGTDRVNSKLLAVTPIPTQVIERLPTSLEDQNQELKDFNKADNGFLDPQEKGLNLNIMILLAYQAGILNGTFHTLPIEKQYELLALLFGKSKANIKNALTALYGNANTTKNPKNLSSIVEKTNNLITEKGLGIALVDGRQK